MAQVMGYVRTFGLFHKLCLLSSLHSLSSLGVVPLKVQLFLLVDCSAGLLFLELLHALLHLSHDHNVSRDAARVGSVRR